jgi:type IV secretory pathway protease TraF
MTRPKFDGRACRNAALLILAAALMLVSFRASGLRINISPSHVNVGLWRAAPVRAGGELEIGDIIAYDKDEFYEAVPRAREDRMIFRAPRVIKKIAALPGAFIERSGSAIAIDGVLYREARISDESWVKVNYPLVVPEGTVWLMADTLDSYDSRYHGPFPAGLVKEKLTPVLVWRAAKEFI